MIKNPPADAGDMDSIPGLGTKIPDAGEQLTLSTTTEAHASRAPQEEKPLQWEAHAPQWRVLPTLHNQKRPVYSNEDPVQPKINKQIHLKKGIQMKKRNKNVFR